MIIKRFKNLLFALFYSSYLFYKQLYTITKAQREYSTNARGALQHNTKTRTLWILLLKAHISAQGKMVGTQGYLGEIKNMVNQLTNFFVITFNT